jgi:ABC-type transport system involved in cytochrome bd biosynthesis fused ATPase/permease subunit
MANFERIQRYLLDSTRQDNRLDVKNSVLESPPPETRGARSRYALVANKISVQYASSLQPILQDINFKVEAGSFWIISGRVGSERPRWLKYYWERLHLHGDRSQFQVGALRGVLRFHGYRA